MFCFIYLLDSTDDQLFQLDKHTCSNQSRNLVDKDLNKDDFHCRDNGGILDKEMDNRNPESIHVCLSVYPFVLLLVHPSIYSSIHSSAGVWVDWTFQPIFINLVLLSIYFVYSSVPSLPHIHQHDRLFPHHYPSIHPSII